MKLSNILLGVGIVLTVFAFTAQLAFLSFAISTFGVAGLFKIAEVLEERL